MKKAIVHIGLIFVLVFLAAGVNAQDRVIHGQVFTFDSIPLVNANVKVKSTKQVVQTDSIGKFSVACNSVDMVTVTAKGFYDQKVKLSENIKVALINLNLKPGEKSREIAIGYGHVTDRDKLNAVSNLNSEDLNFSQYSNIYELIRGRFAGVQIINGEIIIRGKNSLNLSSAALIIVDGVSVNENVLSSIPPVQVKSINIIKDGSSAIYGSRGANGVVIIETKRGGD